MKLEFQEFDLRNEFSEQNKRLLLRRIRVLNTLLNNAENLTQDQVDFITRHFPKFIGVIPLAVDSINNPEFIFERLTINQSVTGNNERLRNLKQLIYPPRELQDKIDFNRANLSGKPMFYSGTSKLPVTIENRPELGQLITETKWKLKQDASLKLFVVGQDGELAMKNPDHLLDVYNGHQKYLGKLSASARAVVEASYEFVISAFTKPVDQARKQGYLLSALFADFLVNHPLTPFDAIYYPSVANDGSFMNVAVSPDAFDKSLDFVSASESVVTMGSANGRKQWFGYHTGECKSFGSQTGELKWKDAIMPSTGSFEDRVIKDFNIKF